MPLISVVMPVYNGEKYLKEAIDSVLNQTLTDFEFIIVDDGSTDNSQSIIDNYNDKRIIIINQENKGLPKALNIGISYTSGIYLARMDQDDICLPDRLMNQYTYLKSHPNISVVSGAVFYIDEAGNYLGRSFPVTHPTLIKKKLLNAGCVINHPSVLMVKKDFDAVGGYSEIIGSKFTDYHLWVKFINKGYKLVNLSRVLLQYRIIQSSMSSEFFFTKSGMEILLKIIKTENPTAIEIDLLNNSYEVGIESYAQREQAYKNKLNYVHFKLFFLNETVKSYLFSAIKNAVAIIK